MSDKKLYQAARGFCEAMPGGALEYDDFFAVELSAHLTGYCAAMLGVAGDLEFIVLLGDGALASYFAHLACGGSPYETSDGELLEPDYLICCFMDRRVLDKRDMESLRRSGIKFYGRGRWPVFRSYHKYCLPWYLSSAQEEYMRRALEAALFLMDHLGGNDKPSLGFSGSAIACVRQKNGEFILGSKRLKDAYPLKFLRPVIDDELLLTRVKKRAPDAEYALECGLVRFPCKISGRRPRYAVALLAVNIYDGPLILPMVEDFEHNAGSLIFELIEFFEEHGLPSAIFVSTERAYALLVSFCASVNVPLNMCSALPVFERAKRDMLQYIGIKSGKSIDVDDLLSSLDAYMPPGRGLCRTCGAELAFSELAGHVTGCGRHAPYAGSEHYLYISVISDSHPEFWLLADVRAGISCDTFDWFLQSAWRSEGYQPLDRCMRPEQPLFGSNSCFNTTTIISSPVLGGAKVRIKVYDDYYGGKRLSPGVLLAQNAPPEFKCTVCGGKAERLFPSAGILICGSCAGDLCVEPSGLFELANSPLTMILGGVSGKKHKKL